MPFHTQHQQWQKVHEKVFLFPSLIFSFFGGSPTESSSSFSVKKLYPKIPPAPTEPFFSHQRPYAFVVQKSGRSRINSTSSFGADDSRNFRIVYLFCWITVGFIVRKRGRVGFAETLVICWLINFHMARAWKLVQEVLHAYIYVCTRFVAELIY